MFTTIMPPILTFIMFLNTRCSKGILFISFSMILTIIILFNIINIDGGPLTLTNSNGEKATEIVDIPWPPYYLCVFLGASWLISIVFLLYSFV